MDEETRQKIELLESKCVMLATALGLATGLRAHERNDRRFIDDVMVCAQGMREKGLDPLLADTFIRAAQIGMEPPDPEKDDKPVAIHRVVVELFKKAA